MKKSELKELMGQYNISERNLKNIIDFITDLIYLLRKEVEEDTPHATYAISNFMRAEDVMCDLLDCIESTEEDA